MTGRRVTHAVRSPDASERLHMRQPLARAMHVREVGPQGGAPGVCIRPLSVHDAREAALLHATQLPHGFFPRLGPTFLREYYRGFALSPHAISVVVEKDGHLEGVAVGVTDRTAHFRWLLRTRGHRLVLAASSAVLLRPWLIGPLITRRLKRYIRWFGRAMSARSVVNRGGARAAVLAHVAVAPSSRGRGMGTELVRRFTETASSAGMAVLRATTLDGDAGAAAFYLRTGWTLDSAAVDWDGHRILVFSREVHVPMERRT